MLNASRTVRRAWFALRAGAVARQGITTVLDQGIVSLTNFSTGVIVARSASVEELGHYSLGFGLVLLLTSVQTSVISVPYNVYGMRVPDGERRAYTGSTLIHHLFISAGSVAVMGAAGLILARGEGLPGMASVVSMIALTIPLSLAREYGRQLFFSRLRFSSALLLDVVVAVVQLGGLLSLARAGRLSATTAYAVTGIACAIAVVLWAGRARGLFQIVPSRVMPTFRTNWVTGRWSLAAGIVAIAGAQLYPWFIAATRGIDQAGVLAACMGITALTNPLLIGSGNFLAPKIMHAHAAGGLRGLQQVTRVALAAVVGAMAVICPLLFLVGGELLGLVYGASYARHGLTVGVLSLALVADWASLPAHYALLFLDRAHVMFKSNLIVLGVAVGLGFPLVAALGAIGAAWGLLAGNLLATAFKWREYRKRVASATVRELAPGAAAYGAGS
jgi:O-antigen/teichoic acid export membrane protein